MCKQPLFCDVVLSKFGKFKGRSRGFAFVGIHKDKVNRALALQDTCIRGRPVAISLADPQAKLRAANEEQEE